MDIRPIRSEEDYEAALHTIAELMEAQPQFGTDDFDRLDVLATLVEAYERENYPVGPADPVGVIEYHLERLGWTQAELARRANMQTSHLSAVLNHQRSLSLNQIKKLSVVFDIPADRLIDTGSADVHARA